MQGGLAAGALSGTQQVNEKHPYVNQSACIATLFSEPILMGLQWETFGRFRNKLAGPSENPLFQTLLPNKFVDISQHHALLCICYYSVVLWTVGCKLPTTLSTVPVNNSS